MIAPAIEFTGKMVTGIELTLFTLISMLVSDDTYRTPLFKILRVTKLNIPKVVGERIDRDMTRELFLEIDCKVVKEKLLLIFSWGAPARVTATPFTRRG